MLGRRILPVAKDVNRFGVAPYVGMILLPEQPEP
jgi:hypothetical protein